MAGIYSEDEAESQQQEELIDEESTVGYLFEPVTEEDDTADTDIVVERAYRHREEIVREYSDTSKWCSCGRCQVMPTKEQNVCCQVNVKSKAILQSTDLRCITDHEWYDQLLQDGPLHIEYQRFLYYHDDKFPQNPVEADILKRKRFCGYRSMVFWLYPLLKRRERRPLPACIYAGIHARFPPTDNEEVFADWLFSEFSYD